MATEKTRPKVAASKLFLFWDILMKMITKLYDKLHLKINKLSKLKISEEHMIQDIQL